MADIKTILIIEQENNLANGLKSILEKDNYHVISVFGQHNLKELLEVNEPDLAIIDVYTPKEFGLNILLKTKESFPGLPIIAMTVYSNSFTIEELNNFGADDFLAKPFDVECLKKKIEELIYSKKDTKNRC